MAQLRQGSYRSSESNVFTVLLVVTAVVIAIGLGYTWYKHQALFDTHPFEVVDRNNRLSFRADSVDDSVQLAADGVARWTRLDFETISGHCVSLTKS